MKLLSIETLAEGLRDALEDEVRLLGTVFLCGASTTDKGKLRGSFLRHVIRQDPPDLRIYMPEQLFDDAAVADQGLISLENVLAGSVDLIVIFPESPGSIAELGAFANHPELVKKLVVCVEERHARANSFIAKGPLRQVRKVDRKRLLTYKPGAELGLFEDLLAYLLVARRHRRTTLDPSSPIHASGILLVALWVAGTLNRPQIQKLLKSMGAVSSGTARASASGAISLRVADRTIVRGVDGYSLGPRGLDLVRGGGGVDLLVVPRRLQLDRVRLDVLESTLRRGMVLAGSRRRAHHS